MYAIGDTFKPKPFYAESLGLDENSVYTIYDIKGGRAYWNGPGLEDIGLGEGDFCGIDHLHHHLTPYIISLENK